MASYSSADVDERFMRMALHVAHRGHGQTAPNPAVGCVLVRHGRVLSYGWTQPSGRPHAEVHALQNCLESTAGATAYVTLEPCCHHGKSPPCTDALIAAGIARVVIGAMDTDPRVAGKSVPILRAAGIAITQNVLAEACIASNKGFFKRLQHQQPWVILKTATSLDGRIATYSGHSQWITGGRARQHTHYMRAKADAILVGIGTVLADNPNLTCRLAGLEDRSPVRVILDHRLRIPTTSALVQTAKHVPVWVLYDRMQVPLAANAQKIETLKTHGVRLFAIDFSKDKPTLAAGIRSQHTNTNNTTLYNTHSTTPILNLLATEGVNTVIVEGGAQVAASFVQDNAVDELHWYRSGQIIGQDGLAAVALSGLTDLGGVPRFQRTYAAQLGEDTFHIYSRI